jgi:catechol 2,3-dioxygenase-like lactoylglutathione lyase family enzyme
MAMLTGPGGSAVIDHMGIGADDFETSKSFYDAALASVGIVPIVTLTPDQTGGYRGVGYGVDGRPFFWLGSGGARGTGMHVAFSASSRAQVDAFYDAALKSGGRDNGPPGLRPYYHPSYYAAFVLDPDGINVEAVCHSSE